MIGMSVTMIRTQTNIWKTIRVKGEFEIIGNFEKNKVVQRLIGHKTLRLKVGYETW